jgi:CRP-like cAMP-binding protein
MMGLHIIACIFFLSARYENFNSETWVMKCNILDFEVFEQYLSSIYWAFMTLSSIGYGDIHPFTTVEYQIAMVWMVVGVFFWSYTSSRFYITLSNIINADIMIKQNLDFAHDFSEVTFLPSALKKRFKSCIKSKRIIIKKISIDRIIDPHDLELRYSVAMDIYNKALTKIKFFQGKGETFIAHFAFKLHFHQFHVDEILWVKKSFSDGIYFISEGRFKVTYDGLMFMIFKAGDYLGDIEIFMRSERKFDCSSCEIGRCFKMDLATLKELKIDYPIYYQELKSNFDNRMKHAMNELSMMYALRLYYTKEISSFNHDVREEIKRRMYYKMFSENFYAMRNNKILDVMHLSKELSQSVKRTSNIIKLLINMNKKEKVKH